MTESKKDCEKLLHKLKKIFYGGSLSIEIEPQDASLMTWDWQQKLLNATVSNDLVQKYPIRRQFIKLFLKKVIEQLEGKQEIHDDFYSHLCIAMNNDPDDGYSYRHYLINEENEIVTIKETNKMVVNGTTGMRTWEAALMLADWALCHKEVFINKTILELGSGVGFTGIAIGKLCQPQCMYLSDCHPDVMKAICDNIRINYPQSQVTEDHGIKLFTNKGKTVGAIPLDWNNIEELPGINVPDVVIGADIVYDPAILQPLCDVLRTLFDRNKDLEVYIASVIRNEETFELFLKYLGPIVKVMVAALKSSGCPIDIRRHISCEVCDYSVSGGYDPELNQIVVCQNVSTRKGMVQGVLAHEMIHMFDYCRNHLDFKNMEHLACTEIRAANLTHCSFTSAWSQGDASWTKIKQAHQDCVKTKALYSVLAVRQIGKKEAVNIIEKVFPKCYADLEPIGRRIRRNSDDMLHAFQEASYYGYE